LAGSALEGRRQNYEGRIEEGRIEGKIEKAEGRIMNTLRPPIPDYLKKLFVVLRIFLLAFY